jgi:hypothetical protein
MLPPSFFDIIKLITSVLGIFAGFVGFFLGVGKFGFNIIQARSSDER